MVTALCLSTCPICSALLHCYLFHSWWLTGCCKLTETSPAQLQPMKFCCTFARDVVHFFELRTTKKPSNLGQNWHLLYICTCFCKYTPNRRVRTRLCAVYEIAYNTYNIYIFFIKKDRYLGLFSCCTFCCTFVVRKSEMYNKSALFRLLSDILNDILITHFLM